MNTEASGNQQIDDVIVVRVRPTQSVEKLLGAGAYPTVATAATARLAALGVVALRAPRGTGLATIARLRQSPAVEFAEPNYLVRLAETVPNDPRLVEQFSLASIQAPRAWDVVTGSPSVTIAVVDTGIDLDHIDLQSKVWVNAAEVPDNGMDDDGDGYVDNVHGWDFSNGDNTPQDDHGHGTHVAGIAAAATDNAIGIAGVSWGARVMPLKVLGANGLGTSLDVAAAIIFAADHGARVINLSLGGDAAAVMELAVTYADERGALVIAAAGNSGISTVLYPAAYDNALAVAATDASNVRASFSSFGSQIDISAPGVGILSLFPGHAFGFNSGTSMATPHVAGAAALLASLPSFDTPEKIRTALESTALDLGPACRDIYYGAGLLQIYAALQFVPDEPPHSSCHQIYFPVLRR